MSNDGGLWGGGVAGFGTFAEADDVTESRWIWMRGEVTYEGIVIASTRSSTAWIACMLSCSVMRTDGVFRRILIHSEAETERDAGSAAEETK